MRLVCNAELLCDRRGQWHLVVPGAVELAKAQRYGVQRRVGLHRREPSHRGGVESRRKKQAYRYVGHQVVPHGVSRRLLQDLPCVQYRCALRALRPAKLVPNIEESGY